MKMARNLSTGNKTASERELQTELELAGITLIASHFSEAGTAEVAARVTKVWGVRNIEPLGAELTSYPLGNRKLTEDSRVQIDITGTAEDISSHIPKRVRCRSGEFGYIKVLSTRTNVAQDFWCPCHVRPIAVARSVQARGTDRDVQRLAGISRKNPCELPIAQDPSARAGLQPTVTRSKRQFPDEALHIRMRPVKACAASVSANVDVVGQASVVVRIVNRFAVGVGSRQQESVAEASVQLDLE